MMKTTLGLIVLLVIIMLLVRMVESRFAFFPLAGETVTPSQAGVQYETLSIATRDDETLCAWALGPGADGPAKAGHYVPGMPRAQIVYFHGNGGNLSIWAPILASIARHGYSVLAFDYRGYGKSTGYPTERGLYRDVDAVLERFWSGSPQSPVLYWGRSLGAAMAAYAATVRAPSGLILESAFPDVRSLVRTSPPMAFLALFSTYRFSAAEFLQRGKAPGVPVLVMHGDEDSVVPISQGRALFERIPGPKRFVTIPGGDHNDVSPRDSRAYWKAVDEFVEGL